MTIAGFILLALGTFVSLMNVYLSFVRYPIHVASGGTRETYRWVSVIPIVGSMFLWFSIPLLPSVGLKWLAAVFSVFDTGGIHWCIGMMWWTGQLRLLFPGRPDRTQ